MPCSAAQTIHIRYLLEQALVKECPVSRQVSGQGDTMPMVILEIHGGHELKMPPPFPIDSILVSTAVNTDFISIRWTIENPIVQQQLQSVQVTVRSGCLTGVGQARTLVFNITPDEGTSKNITGLGIDCG